MYAKMVATGRIGNTPELKYSDNGTPMCRFSLAVDVGYGEKKKTMWLRCVCFNATAEAVNQHKKKGDMVIIETDGVEASPYMNKAGEAAASLECVAQRVVFIGGNRTQGEQMADEQDMAGIPF